MNAKYYIRKGEQWCTEYACQINWNVFECEQTVFSKEFQEDFKFEIQVYTWRNDKGELHREDGPAIECENGDKSWWVNGQLHREDGPAVEWANGDKEWWVNGKRHREDGPAVIYANGEKAWYINGKWLTEKEFNHQCIIIN